MSEPEHNLMVLCSTQDRAGGWGEWCSHPEQQHSSSGKTNILNEKKLIFCAQQNLSY
jgi:hypothetical protein